MQPKSSNKGRTTHNDVLLSYTADNLPNRCFNKDLHLTTLAAFSTPTASSTALVLTHDADHLLQAQVNTTIIDDLKSQDKKAECISSRHSSIIHPGNSDRHLTLFHQFLTACDYMFGYMLSQIRLSSVNLCTLLSRLKFYSMSLRHFVRHPLTFIGVYCMLVPVQWLSVDKGK